MKREFSLKQIMQMILVCLLLVAVVYIFYRADHAELSQLNGPVTASQGAAPLKTKAILRCVPSPICWTRVKARSIT